ncbi:MAG: nitrilase-related carbon-nitrogen hydrolase [Trueperaceae bacterium]
MQAGGRQVWMAAVQARMAPGPYRSAAAFEAWVTGLARRAVQGAPPGAPRLVAFPEAIGLPLLFTPPPTEQDGHAELDAYAAAPDLGAAALRLLRADWRAVLAAAWRHRVFGPSALYLTRAVPAYRAYATAFRAAARASDAVVVAGSAFLPEVEEEPARGVHVTRPWVHNVAATFSPSGALLGRSRKVFLTPGAESRAGLRRGRIEDLPVLDTPAGRVGVAVCLDGWYDGVVGALDGRGAQVVVQPSANDAAWERPWPPDRRLTEGEAWLQRGLRAGLQGRLNLRYGLNPMLVGDFAGFRPRGRSSILANAGATGVGATWAEGREGVLALARSADAEEVVTALVALG